MSDIPWLNGGERSTTSAARRPARLLPIEVLTLGYLAVTGLIFILFRRNLPAWGVHAAAHGAGMIGIIALACLSRLRSHRIIRFVRLWSPLLWFIFFFEEIEPVVHVIYPGWFDALLIRADYALWGVYPTVWLERYANIWLNEYMQFAYTSYFLLVPVLGGVLYYRAQWRAFGTVMLSTAIAYYLCYVTFLLFPIEGPYHTLRPLQTVELRGAYFTAVIDWIEGFGRVHGGAFPSAHVAGSTVVLICAYRFARRLFWCLLPIILSLFVATVYGRYHYASDVLAGWLVGALGAYLGSKISDTKDQNPESRIQNPEVRQRKRVQEKGRRDSSFRSALAPTFRILDSGFWILIFLRCGK